MGRLPRRNLGAGGYHIHQCELKRIPAGDLEHSILTLIAGFFHTPSVIKATFGHPHGAEFRREMDCISPTHEFCFNLVVEILIVGECVSYTLAEML